MQRIHDITRTIAYITGDTEWSTSGLSSGWEYAAEYVDIFVLINVPIQLAYFNPDAWKQFFFYS